MWVNKIYHDCVNLWNVYFFSHGSSLWFVFGQMIFIAYIVVEILLINERW